MLLALYSADALTLISILVKALAYATTLVAAGSVLVALSLKHLDSQMRRTLARIAVIAAVSAAVLSVFRLPVRASFLMGGALDGALDPMILRVVADSPLGTSITLRLFGLALILSILVPRRWGIWIAAAGSVVVAASFAFRGHALDEPRLLLGFLVTTHILGLAFWVGAFQPLARAALTRDHETAGALAQEFGRKALWVVAFLVAAGVVMLVLLGAATPAAIATPYGQAFAVKLALFAVVLAIAALNKRRLTPALVAATPGSGRRLRRSIRVEAVLVGAILLTTAAATTLSSPPGRTGQSGMTERLQAPVSSPTEAMRALS